MTDKLAERIQTIVQQAVRSEASRIVNEEADKALNNIRRRLAARAAEITSQISCQLVPQENHYVIEIKLPGAGVAKQLDVSASDTSSE